MHSTLTNILARVTHTIHPELLNLGMRIAQRYGDPVNNTTEFVLKKILRERVLLDCNISGGPIKYIVLRLKWKENVFPELTPYAMDDGGFDLYRIPPEARDNLPLTQVIRVSYPYSTVGDVATVYANEGQYSVLAAANSMLDSFTLASEANPPLCSLLSGDIVKIFPSQNSHIDWVLTCRTSYDENFSNLDVSAVRTICKLTELAVKAYIHTNLYISIDRAAQEFGVDVSTIRQAVEDCRDANQMYDEQLNQWQGTALMDPEARAIYTMFNL